MQHQVRQVVAEILAVLDGQKVACLLAPVGDRVDHTMDQLCHAGFALGRAQLAVKILAGDDVGGGLRPIGRHFDITLLEDDSAFIVADGGRACLPCDFVVRGLSRLQTSREIPLELDAGARPLLILLGVQ